MQGARLAVVAALLIGCSSMPDAAGEAPLLDLSVDDEVFGTVGASSWCRTSFGLDACVGVDGPVPEFVVGCESDVHLSPEREGWRLQESNVPVDPINGKWSIGSVAGDVLVDMDARNAAASWFFTLKRSDC